MKKVLIVDDAKLIRNMLRDAVSRMGLTVVAEGTDGEEAVSLYREHRPDVVTMDITMPKMDGVAATREILKLDPDARIVMITSLGQESVMRECILAGARDFIVKPFQEDRIVAALRRVLEIEEMDASSQA